MKNFERFMGFFSDGFRTAAPGSRSACTSGLASMFTGCGCTSAPGRTRCRPLTTMRSPALSPSLTTRRPLTDAPSVTSRYSALLPSPTTSTNFLFWSVPTARSLTSRARAGLGLAHADARELAGHQRAVLVVEGGAHAHGAALGIDLVVDQLQAALVGRVGRRRRAHLHRDALDQGAGAGAAGHVLERAGDDLLVGVEAGIDRADRHQRGEHRRAGAGGNQIARW